MNNTGYACGVKIPEGMCMHESRRKALDCNRRLLEVCQSNRAERLDLALVEMTRERDNLATEIIRLNFVVKDQKDAAEAAGKDLEKAKETIDGLTFDLAKANATIAELEPFRPKTPEVPAAPVAEAATPIPANPEAPAPEVPA